MLTQKQSNHSQHGYALLALLLIVVVSGSTLVLAGLNNRQSVAIREQQELTYQMEQAKAALLAFAANSATLFNNQRGPGYLPCPDTASTDPDSDSVPNNGSTPNDDDGSVTESYDTVCTNLIGRLPEETVVNGVKFSFSNYLSGVDRQFWYAVGPRYTNTSGATSSTTRQAIRRVSTTNTNATSVRLLLDGVSEYVAFVIAPGEELETQDRASSPDSYSAYLDYSNGSSYSFRTSYPNNPDQFNDVIVGITLDEYMRAVGLKVAIEIQKTINAYHATYGAYPTSSGYSNSSFPNTAPSNSSQSAFRGLFSSSYSWLISTTAGNGERWTNYTFYKNDSSNVSRIAFNGCPGMVFTINFGVGITPPSPSASC